MSTYRNTIGIKGIIEIKSDIVSSHFRNNEIVISQCIKTLISKHLTKNFGIPVVDGMDTHVPRLCLLR